MIIREYYYNEDTRCLSVEFSTKEDKDDLYRKIELEYWDIEYYSPEIITKNSLRKIGKDFIIEIISQYLKENELPEPQTL